MTTEPIKLDYVTPPAKKSWPSIIQIAATLFIVAAVLVEVREIFHDAELQTFWGYIQNGTTADFTKPWKDHGDLLKQIAPTGNVAILYRGFNPANVSATTFAVESHFLGEYQIYPRRVFTADETTVINKGQDVLNPSFMPTVPWLQKNGVLVVATYSIHAPNQLQVQTQVVPPASVQGGR